MPFCYVIFGVLNAMLKTQRLYVDYVLDLDEFS
jgi:hypothetical protein